MQEKTSIHNELETQFELQKIELNNCQRRISDLENEVLAYGDWKNESQVC